MGISTTNNAEHQEFSIVGTILWFLLLSVGIQAGICIVICNAVKVSGSENNEVESIFLRPDIMLMMVIMTSIISIPFIKRAAYSTDKMFPYAFITLRTVQHTTLMKALLAGFTNYCFISLSMTWYDFKYPQHMLNVKSHVRSNLDLVFLILTVCIIAPAIEEVVFIGQIFSRFQPSYFGKFGAVFIPNIIFPSFTFNTNQ